MFLKAELYSIKMVNSTGEKSRVRGVITKWGGGGRAGAHIALLPVTSKIISINIFNDSDLPTFVNLPE